MRPDSIGFFWQELPRERGRNAVARVMPAIPETGWAPPRDYPNLSAADVLSIDTETYDPELLEHGPGWARGKGHIVGVSIATRDGGRWYFPIRHEVESEYNLDPAHTLAWLRDTLARPVPVIGANLLYDVGWLRQEGVRITGPLHDVQFAEALLGERNRTALEVLAQKYLGENKETSLLYQWCADYYGGKADPKQRANIYRAPPRLVGPYAEMDADLPLRILPHQWPQLVSTQQTHVYELECDLIPLLIEMRFAGVRVDIGRAEQLRDELVLKERDKHAQLRALVGFDVNVNAAESISQAFDRQGITYGRTATGKPSFTKGFLETIEHPVAECILGIRRLEKLRSTFVESYILGSHVNGKVYGQFHPLRGDAGGTRSGRFASSTPNLQNIPSRDEELAPRTRAIFVPDEGHKQWRRFDYSQIEYRKLVHFAIGPGSDEARQRYINDPETDYHEYTIALLKEKAGITLARKPAKIINFGLIYGMGLPKLIRTLNLDRKAGKELFDAYHKGVPFARATMEATIKKALEDGYITTVFGRRSHFDLWEPSDYDQQGVPLPYDLAIRTYGYRIQRAMAHKALNRQLQGSAADLQKLALRECWRNGVFAAIGVPRLIVHDEADFSDPGGCDDGFREFKRISETVIPLRVPVIADEEVGPNWGEVS